MTIEQLRAELAQARTVASAKVAEAVETTRIRAELNLLTNEPLQRAQAIMQVRVANLDKLNELNSACEAIVTSMPIHSTKTRENRKWSPSAIYGYGSELGKLVSLLSGIQYSASAHREQMLAYTGLPEALIEATLESFGSEPYYNKNYCTIVEGKPMDVASFVDNIQLVASALGIVLDISKFNQSTVDNQYRLATIRAEKLALEDAKALNTTSLQLD